MEEITITRIEYEYLVLQSARAQELSAELEKSESVIMRLGEVNINLYDKVDDLQDIIKDLRSQIEAS